MSNPVQAAKLAELRASRPKLDGSTREPETPSNHPRYGSEAFICPHCNAYAHQKWWDAIAQNRVGSQVSWGPETDGNFAYSHCQHCRLLSFWVRHKLVHPATSTAPMPVPDMPDDVRVDFLEARDVYEKSPRSAGGLLRIGFEKLLKHVGATKSSPNEAIGELVQKGLALGTQQQAMDVMRVFSNQSVHDGFVKLEDQPATVGFLFNLMNYIVEQLITRPNHIQAMFSGLPPDKLAGIEKRDAKK